MPEKEVGANVPSDMAVVLPQSSSPRLSSPESLPLLHNSPQSYDENLSSEESSPPFPWPLPVQESQELSPEKPSDSEESSFSSREDKLPFIMPKSLQSSPSLSVSINQEPTAPISGKARDLLSSSGVSSASSSVQMERESAVNDVCNHLIKVSFVS